MTSTSKIIKSIILNQNSNPPFASIYLRPIKILTNLKNKTYIGYFSHHAKHKKYEYYKNSSIHFKCKILLLKIHNVSPIINVQNTKILNQVLLFLQFFFGFPGTYCRILGVLKKINCIGLNSMYLALNIHIFLFCYNQNTLQIKNNWS